QKLPLLITCLVGIPLPWLMGQVSTVWGLTLLTALLWFTGGLGIALVGILAGLSAGEDERGKIFGVLALTGGLGALVGGLGTGWLVSRWGYTTMFNMITILMALWPLCAIFLKETETKPPGLENHPAWALPGLGKSFYLLFVASTLSSISVFFVILIRSILMNNLEFGPLEITSTGAIGGLVAMPFPLLMGLLSDRIGRKTLLVIGYLTALASIVLLAFSKELWNFWIVFMLQGIATGSAGIGSALVTDLVPRESFGKGLSIFNSSAWIGGIIGSAAGGYILQNAGFLPTFIIGGFLAVAAIGLLIPIQAISRRTVQPGTVTTV
ncbi:MAG: MFS transporter, partial [Omnitrophica WOR_2 bacterium]